MTPVAFLTLLVVGQPASALPNSGPDPYDAALIRAVAAKERALDVNDPARWEEALRLFQEAAARRPTRECAYEIGVSAERLGRHDLAVEAYQDAIARGLAGPPRLRAETFVAERLPSLARVQVEGPAGTRLRVAGADRGQLPLDRPLVLFPGQIRIESIDQEGRATEHTVIVGAGQLQSVRVEASRSPPSPASPAPVPLEPSPAPVPRFTPPAAGGPAAIPAGGGDSRGDNVEVSSRSTRISSLGWPLVVGGALVAAAAAVILPVSQDQLDSHRVGLVDTCVVAPADDYCALAKTGRGNEAQTHVDGIVTWKVVRTGAWVGLGVGVAAAAVGIVSKLAGPRGARGGPARAGNEELWSGRLSLGLGTLSWTRTF